MKYSQQDMGIPKVELDPNAWTQSEIWEARGGSTGDLQQYIREKLASGQWEETRKLSPTSGRRVKAYRPKRRKI